MKARFIDRADDRHDDRDDARPGRATSQRDAGAGNEDAEEQVHPSPGRVVDADHQAAVSDGVVVLLEQPTRPIIAWKRPRTHIMMPANADEAVPPGAWRLRAIRVLLPVPGHLLT